LDSPFDYLDPGRFVAAVLEDRLFNVDDIVIPRSSRKYLLRALKNKIPPEVGKTHNKAALIDSMAREDRIVFSRTDSLRKIINSGI
jgi:hypothetical protein